jgi:Cu-Zn family superoxide dismutase
MRPAPVVRRLSTVVAIALLGLAAGCNRGAPPPAAEAPPPAPAPAPAPPPPAPVTATANVSGQGISGALTLVADPEGVHITGTLSGLPADSDHGFHVHEKGDCSAFATGSAGTHLNPDQQPHGNPAGTAHHAGDLPFLHADASGQAAVDVRVAGADLGSGDGHDLAGRALVVHEKLDDYSTQPSGASGTPVACGVIELPAAPAAAP